MLPFRYQRLAGTTAVVLDVVVLRVGWVPPAELTTHLAHPRRWVDATGTDAATLELARVGLWLVGVWLALAMVAVLASRLPGACGRVADGVAGRAVPAVLRRAIAAALGASVVLVPVAAGASTNGATPAATSATTATTGAAEATHLSGGWSWPTSTSAPLTPAPATPAPKTPTTPTAPSPTPTPGRTSAPASTTPAKPVPWPHSAKPAPSAPRPTSGDVVVKAGDCLWAIAAHRLGPHASPSRIAAETQRWYQANAATIGADPSLIHPGQQLHQPTEKGR